MPGTQLIDPITKAPFPNNQIPTSRLSPVAQNFFQYIPLPNAGGRQLNYTGAKDQETENQFMPKVDYTHGKHQLSVISSRTSSSLQ